MNKQKRKRAGRKGGQNGTGDAKRRSPEFYSITLPAARAAAKAKRGEKNEKA